MRFREINGFRRSSAMKQRLEIVLVIALLGTPNAAMAADGTWTGYIADSKCGAQAANDGARECTIKCVKAGARYVFVSDGDKKIFAIDDQSKVAEHAGHHVTVKGTVEGDTLKLSSIEMAAMSK
jgi:hypothetical protein